MSSDQSDSEALDQDREAADEETEEEPQQAAPERFFHPMPLAQLLLFGVLGGNLFSIYWMYRNWEAYFRADGYSREPFWRGLREKTGYRPRPFWRAVFGGPYTLSLFPAIRREGESQRVRPLPAPLALALGMNVFLLPTIGYGVVPVLLLLPVQAAINRLNESHAAKRWAVGGLEVLVLAFGALVQWGTR